MALALICAAISGVMGKSTVAGMLVMLSFSFLIVAGLMLKRHDWKLEDDDDE
jgi:hypothetical protein